MSNLTSLVSVALLFAVLWPGRTDASYIGLWPPDRRLDRLRDACETSAYIVLADIESATVDSAGYDLPGIPRYYTNFRARVIECLKGQTSLDSVLVFRAEGDWIHRRGLLTIGASAPNVGARYLLFLDRYPRGWLHHDQFLLTSIYKGGGSPFWSTSFTPMSWSKIREDVLARTAVTDPSWQKRKADAVVRGRISRVSLASPADYSLTHGTFHVGVDAVYKRRSAGSLRPGEDVIVSFPQITQASDGIRALPIVEDGATCFLFLRRQSAGTYSLVSGLWSLWTLDGDSLHVETKEPGGDVKRCGSLTQAELVDIIEGD